jgi:phage tail-like protein
MPTDDPNPYGNYYFKLEIDGLEVGHFVECSGLKAHTEVYEIQEGGINGYTHKRPTGFKWDNLVLRFATSASTHLATWVELWLTGEYGDGERRDGSVTLMSNDGKDVKSWHFRRGWPVSWEGPQLSASGSELAVESIEIAHEGIEIATSGRKPTTGRV